MAEVQWIKESKGILSSFGPKSQKSLIYLQDMAKLMVITEMIDDRWHAA